MMPEEINVVRETALKLFDEQGWFVIPTDPGAKKPYYGFTYKDRYGDNLPSREEVNHWPEWNAQGVRLGARTGAVSDIIVVDCDSKEAHDFIKTKGHPIGPMAQSPREGGGLHLYFKHPGFYVKSAVGFAGIDGLDIRGDYGIVVLPPSPDHKTGRAYEWIISPDEVSVPECPNWLIELLHRQSDFKQPLDVPKIMAGIPEGQRDNELNRLAGKFRQMNLPEDVAVPMIELAAERCSPPFNKAEARAKVKWAYTHYEPGEDPAIFTVESERTNGSQGLTTFSLSELMGLTFPPVRWAIQGLLPEGTMIFAGKPKMGKAQPLDALVLTPSGWKKMGGLKVGDYVIGSDGKPTRITAIHPQGVKPCYQVRVTGGSSVEATGDHLWQVQSHDDRVREKLGSTFSTEEIATKLQAGRTRDTYLPTVAPVQFRRQRKLLIDPYLMGVLLGDGGLTKGVTVTTVDPEIIQQVEKKLPVGMAVRPFPNAPSFSIVAEKRGKPNLILQSIRGLGLYGLKSLDKFIPWLYLRSSVKDRISLLQGLMDTDGSIEPAFIFSTSSFRLSCNVKELVESLGGCATVRPKPTSHRLSYRVTIRLPETICPFRLERKAKKWREKPRGSVRPPLRRIEGVSYSRDAETQCITVEAQNGLYVTEDYIVTHNSWAALGFCISVATGGKALGEFDVEVGDVLYLALEDQPRRLQSRAAELLKSELAGPLEPDRLDLVTRSKRLDSGLLPEIEEWLKAHPEARLIVIDTLGSVRGRSTTQRTLYEQDYEIGAALTKLAGDYSVCILIVHHLKKGDAEDPLDMISGSTGLTGGMDGSMVLNRTRSAADGILKAVHRDLEEDPEIALIRVEKDEGWWKFAGDAEEYRIGKERREILGVLANADEPMRPKAIADELDKPAKNISELLRKMRDEGHVDTAGYGLYVIGRVSPPQFNSGEPDGSDGTNGSFEDDEERF